MKISSILMSQLMSLKTEPSHDFTANSCGELVLSNPERKMTLIVKVTERCNKNMEKIVSLNSESVVANLISIYQRIDEETARQKHSICKKGCSHCCTNDVAISFVEFFHILNYIGINYSEDFVKRLPDSFSANLTNRCFFVDTTDSLCKIYEVRPIICRKYGLYKTYTDCPLILANDKSKNELHDGLLFEENIDFIYHNGKMGKIPFDTMHYFFTKYGNGDFPTRKLKDLYSVAFTGSVADYIKILCL